MVVTLSEKKADRRSEALRQFLLFVDIRIAMIPVFSWVYLKSTCRGLKHNFRCCLDCSLTPSIPSVSHCGTKYKMVTIFCPTQDLSS